MRNALLSLCSLLLLACGSTTTTNTGTTGTGSTTSTGTGGASSTSGSTGAGGSTTSTGAGGSTTSTGTGGSTTTTTTTGAGGGSGCMGTIDLAVDNGPQVHYTSVCNGSFGSGESSTALGYEFSGGPAPGTQALEVLGCISAAPNSEGIQLSLKDAIGPGTYTMGSVTWTDPGGIAWGVQGDPFSVQVFVIGAVGSGIDGHITATVTHGGNAAHSLEGTFHVCRVNDLLAP